MNRAPLIRYPGRVAKKTTDADEVPEPKAQGKGRPTRTRKEAEAANLRPLVPNDRKLAKQRAKEARDEAFAREREALRTGDERYLPVRDKGKVRRFVRDWLDARWSLSEFLLPTMLIFLAVMLVVSFTGANNPTVNAIVVGLMISFYLLLFASIVEAIFVWQRLKRRIRKVYPNDPIPRGTWFYVYTRMLMARRWRSPKPQVGRGEFPTGKPANR